MTAPQGLTKEQLLEQLQKEGVTDLDSLADLILTKAHQGGNLSEPIANSVIIYPHGFVTS
jgi:hypothetical protein